MASKIIIPSPVTRCLGMLSRLSSSFISIFCLPLTLHTPVLVNLYFFWEQWIWRLLNGKKYEDGDDDDEEEEEEELLSFWSYYINLRYLKKSTSSWNSNRAPVFEIRSGSVIKDVMFPSTRQPKRINSQLSQRSKDLLTLSYKVGKLSSSARSTEIWKNSLFQRKRSYKILLYKNLSSMFYAVHTELRAQLSLSLSFISELDIQCTCQYEHKNKRYAAIAVHYWSLDYKEFETYFHDVIFFIGTHCFCLFSLLLCVGLCLNCPGE